MRYGATFVYIVYGFETPFFPGFQANQAHFCFSSPNSQASDAVHLPNERMSRTVLARAVDAIAGRDVWDSMPSHLFGNKQFKDNTTSCRVFLKRELIVIHW